MLQDEFITQLRQQLGMSELNFNQDGVCRLIVDQQLLVDIEWVDDGNLQVYAALGGSRALQPAQLRDLLHANAYGQGTGGATLAIDEDADEVLLQRAYQPAALEMFAFIADLESLINYAQQWTRRLLAGGDSEQTATALAAPPVGAMLQV